jgi:hypothetical protein
MFVFNHGSAFAIWLLFFSFFPLASSRESIRDIPYNTTSRLKMPWNYINLRMTVESGRSEKVTIVRAGQLFIGQFNSGSDPPSKLWENTTATH